MNRYVRCSTHRQEKSTLGCATKKPCTVKAILDIKKLGLLFLMVLIALLCSCFICASNTSSAFAESTDQQEVATLKAGNDVFKTGLDITINGETLQNDLIVSGKSVNILNTTAAGGIHAAGIHAHVKSTSVVQSLSLAGYNVSVDGGKALATVLTGYRARYAGECNDLQIFGYSIIMDGVVHGDVHLNGENVTIGPNAKIDGKIYINTATDPTINSSAIYDDMLITKNGVTNSFSSAFNTLKTDTGMGILGAAWILWSFFGFLWIVLIALFAEIFFRKHTATAAAMIKSRTGAMIGTGILSPILFPVGIFLVICLLIALAVACIASILLIPLGIVFIACLIALVPVVFCLIFALLCICIVGVGFSVAAFSKLLFPRMGRIKAVLLMALIVGVVSVIPIMNKIIAIAGFMFLLAYIIQCIHLSIRSSKAVKVD